MGIYNIFIYTAVPLFYNPLKPPFMIRLLDLVPKVPLSVLNSLYFKTTCNARPHFIGPMVGLKIEVLLYT